MKRFAAAALALAVFALSGCMPSTEIKDTAIIQSMAIDKDEADYVITLQKFSPNKEAGEQKGSSHSELIQGKGSSIAEAMNQISIQQGKEIFLGSNNLVIIGMDAAKEGILPIIQYLNSDYTIFPKTYLMVSEGQAADILEIQVKQETSPNPGLLTILRRNDHNACLMDSTLIEVVSDLQNPATSPFAPLIRSTAGPGGQEHLEVSGVCIFRRDKAVDTLNQTQTMGLSFLTNSVDETLLTVNDPRLGSITFLVSQSKAKIKSRLSGQAPTFEITIRCKASVNKAVGDNVQISPEELTYLEEILSAKIQQLSVMALERGLYQNSSDIFSLCRYLKQQQPAYWRENEDHWEEILPDCRFVVAVESRIQQMGEISPGVSL